MKGVNSRNNHKKIGIIISRSFCSNHKKIGIMMFLKIIMKASLMALCRTVMINQKMAQTLLAVLPVTCDCGAVAF